MKMKISILGILFLLSYPLTLEAQLSPGPLAKPHDHLSGFTNCLSCHIWGSKDLSPKCLDCHTPIQNRITAKTGFHGNLESTTCIECHSDHVGLDFELIHWDPSQKEFDHNKSGFELKGKHIGLELSLIHI